MATVLVAREPNPDLSGIVSALTNRDYLLLNADNKSIYPLLNPTADNPRLITYGFNAKSCITASSVTENGMQVCIQRAFTGADGHVREPQEFYAPIPAGADVSDALAAAAVYSVVINPEGAE
jgi:UDP-N-acetylmuramate-alanine ligase